MPRDTVFVVGSMRSGTTLLQRTLCSLPELGPMLSEAAYLSRYLQLVADMAPEFDMRLQDQFGTYQHFLQHARRTSLDYLRELKQRHCPGRRLVLKSPELSHHIGRLGRWLPEAAFVVSVRDPRDVVASIVEVAERHRAAGVGSPLTHAGRDMAALSAFMLRHYADPLAAQRPLAGRLHFVRYEDLAAQNEAATEVLRRVTGRASAAPSGSVQDSGAAAVPYFDEKQRRRDPFHNAFWSDGYTQPATTARIGRFRDVLTPEEIAAVEARCASFGQAFRYW